MCVVDLAYQPDGRLAVDANADEACDIPDRGHARVADGRIQPHKLVPAYRQQTVPERGVVTSRDTF